VAEQFLHGADIVPGFQQMRGKTVATSIVTLLMIRGLFKFTTDTIRTMASPSTLSAVCDIKAMKHSS
jgi:preprotein translocase subunit SecF